MKERVLTALALIPIVLVAVFLKDAWAIDLLAIAIVCIGISEIGKMLRSDAWIYGGFLTLALPYLMPGDYMGNDLAGQTRTLMADAGFGRFLLGVLFAGLIASKPNLAKTPLAALAACWVLGPMESLISLHSFAPRAGSPWFFASPILLAIVPLWGGDTAAIFAGRAWGKHKLAPSISPKKTWEGAIANLLACVAVAIPLALWIGYPWPIGLTCGLAAGILGQAGDLFESYVKRKADLKDSGTLLPGHGGVMDRIDSILFTAPAVALILTMAS
ncbi:phosphatidate cytidylyltransferase [Fimbriimonas ginsengisoli]|uniref:Phosphatidate cytidylyltransferase n=1 Tax=Fimbriimonas ginsengisoli Gsoil 348 TaxID=661478 RepID=A0A068NQW4_FIMGI|nr:phosphatidate cytidylyltransferase [Fimbriimonas ginsengisoli]AIE85125.1 Phosphatidate cytidylyltransferase [Fimbriimonas ginsengisoli Gsoil 348]